MTAGPGSGSIPHRIATISVLTSPLAQPGGGDAGGLNVYVVETARRFAEAGIQVEIFTRAAAPRLPPVVELCDGVLVRHVPAGPAREIDKGALPRVLGEFTAGMRCAPRSALTSCTLTIGCPAVLGRWWRGPGGFRSSSRCTRSAG